MGDQAMNQEGQSDPVSAQFRNRIRWLSGGLATARMHPKSKDALSGTRYIQKRGETGIHRVGKPGQIALSYGWVTLSDTINQPSHAQLATDA